SNPLAAHHLSRLIVEIQDGASEGAHTKEALLVYQINDTLQHYEDSKHMCIVNVKFNVQNNCIVFTRADQQAAELAPFADRFMELIAGERQVRVHPDRPWYKVQLNGVSTWNEHTRAIPTPADMQQELVTNNPEYAKMEILEQPRWMCHPTDLRTRMYSSVVIALAHEADTTHLIKHIKNLAIAGLFAQRPDYTVTLRSDLANDLNLQVLEVCQHPHPTTLLINLYNNDKKQGKRSAAKHLERVLLPEDIPVIVSGDWNLHHPMWSRHATLAKPATELTVDWLTQRGYSIKNVKGEPTYYSHSHKTYSTIDLTFLNPKAAAMDAVKLWCVDQTLAFGSDHFALRWVLDYGGVEIDNVGGKRFNFKDAKPKEWQAAFTAALEMRREDINVLLDSDANLTPKQLDTAADALTAAMQPATEETVPIRKASDK
ncbi:Endonuclease/exonuclease/phosphatase, partial [Amylocystis lapponica]